MQDPIEAGISRRNLMLGAATTLAAAATPAIGLAASAADASVSSASAPGASAPGASAPGASVLRGGVLDLLGKRALVTGASRGIGAGIALALASRGADVVITYLRSTDKAAAVVRDIKGMGRRGVAVQADSGDPAAVKHSIDVAVWELGGLDILVNNVGIARSAPLTEMSLADIDAMLGVNARSAVLASQAAIPHMTRGGRIVTIGSCLAERVPYPNLTVYSMSKSALLAFTRGLARELGPRDITVNLIQPGPIDTDQNPADGEWAEPNRRLTSLGRYGVPADIAAAVAYLASPAAQFMTGSVMTVDAGFNA